MMFSLMSFFLVVNLIGCDDEGVDRLSADECHVCLWHQHQGHILSMRGSILDVS